MKPIATEEGTKAILKRYPFAFKKKFGQNFLINPQILTEIISAAEIDQDDCVIEIGPGIGSVTQELLKNAGKVIAIEIDTQLIPILEENFKEYNNLKIIHEDVLKLDLHKVIAEEAEGKKVKVVANLPYYITTPIIMMLLENNLPIETITVMVQKEVADRMDATPGNKQYGAITVALNYYATTSLVVDVPRDCFMPSPNVDSAVIQLGLYSEPPVNVEDEQLLLGLIKAAFAQRRKTLLNTLHSQAGLSLSKEELKDILDNTGIGSSTRGETLSLQDFAKLSQAISNYSSSNI